MHHTYSNAYIVHYHTDIRKLTVFRLMTSEKEREGGGREEERGGEERERGGG